MTFIPMIPDFGRQAQSRDLERQSQLAQYQAVVAPAGGAYPVTSPARESTMLDRLRNVDALVSKYPVETYVELAAYGRRLAEEYTLQEIPAPKWLAESLQTLAREIKARHRADKEAALRRAEAELEELRSREEKREAKEAEVKRLREELGGQA